MRRLLPFAQVQPRWLLSRACGPSLDRRCHSTGCLRPSSVLRGTRMEKRWSRAAATHDRQRQAQVTAARRRTGTASASAPTTYDLTSTVTRGVSNSAAGSGDAPLALPALRCPGGPRMKAEGIKHLYKVPHAGYLAKYDQRFVLNLKLTHQLVSYLSRTTLTTPDKVLVELGPGVGSLTRSLLTRPCVGVLGIEMDERFNPHLEQIRSYTKNKFQWVNADVLKVDELQLLTAAFPAFVAANVRRPPSPQKRQQQRGPNDAHADAAEFFEGAPLRSNARERLLRQRSARAPYQHGSSTRAAAGGDGGDDFNVSPNPAFDVTDQWWSNGNAKVEVVANLPFDIITELLMRYAADCARHRGIFAFGRVPVHVFLQREVAERVLAPAGSVEFSRLSVLCQCFFHVRLKQTFVDQTFYPRTEVEGAMLTLEPRTVPLAHGLDAATLIHFTDLLMKPGMRGATVHKSLRQFAPAELVQYMLQELHMDGAMTVLDLSVAEVTKLASLWQQFLRVSQQQGEGGSAGSSGDGPASSFTSNDAQ